MEPVSERRADGELVYVYAVSDDVLFHTDGETSELRTGDVLQASVRAPSWIRPLRPPARGVPSPRVVVVDLGPPL